MRARLGLMFSKNHWILLQTAPPTLQYMQIVPFSGLRLVPYS